jgi:hypothetical protein
MLQRDFLLGEKKYIKFKATSCDNAPVVITEATYKLFADNVLSDTGSCTVNGNEFMALIEPKEPGDYILEAEYTVAPEIRKVRVAIHVT